MNDKKIDAAKEYFSSLFEMYGVDEKSLGWSKNKQDVRFEQIFKYIDGEIVSVLDVGCGFGDMYSYLERCGKYKQIDYCGIDIINSFIEIGKQKYEKKGAQFLCTSLMDFDSEKQWDWVVECGLFGLNLYDDEEQMYEYVRESMERAFLIANKGISFNFLSDKVDFRTSNKDFHLNPERILKMAFGLSRRVILDNSVMPFEFSVTVWKDDTFLPSTTIFESYIKESIRG